MPKDGLPVGARLESLEREVHDLRRELRAATERGNAQRSSIVRTRRLEIVDDQGRVRASLSVMPAGQSARGDRYPETVLLRLITEQGRPSVKISTSEESAGVSLAGPSGTRDTYVILEAKGTATALKLKNENGRAQTVTP